MSNSNKQRTETTFCRGITLRLASKKLGVTLDPFPPPSPLLSVDDDKTSFCS